MKKVLVLASVASMIQQFNMSNIKILLEIGYKVDVACNFENGGNCSAEKIAELKKNLSNMNVVCHQISFARDVLNLSAHKKAYKQVKTLIEENQYAFVHCHAPIGGVITRIAIRSNNTKIIYTAHGFHFYRGAPLLNWLIYYPLEKHLSKHTDVLITINQEDYDLAKKKMKAKKVCYIPGVGLDVNKFYNTIINRDKKREELGIPKDSTVLLSVGELNNNKNHEVIIKAMKELDDSNIQYIIVGIGCLKSHIENISRDLGLTKNVHLLGYRDDIAQLCKAADIFCFPSYREGLGLAALEAMASGLPLITSNIRGINEYAINNKTALVFAPDDIKGFASGILKLTTDESLRIRMAHRNIKEAQRFDIKYVDTKMREIYTDII